MREFPSIVTEKSRLKICLLCKNPRIRPGCAYCSICYNTRQRKLYRANPTRYLEYAKRNGPKYEKANKKACLNKYGNERCTCCGETIFEFLTLDHINGRKRGHVIDTLRGVHLYRWLKKHDYPKDLHLRVLCCNCNFSLGTYGYCPHTDNK
jgi:hypothetical protein